MSYSFLTTLAALTVAVQGLNPWQAPGPDDSRGPCPMLNTLANHGYLPHSGRNLTVQQFGDAMAQGLNADPLFGTAPATGFTLVWGRSTFDLEDLNTPGLIQHIASLTRDDVTPAEANIGEVPARVSALLDDSPTDYLDVASLAKSRVRVEALSAPQRIPPQHEVLALTEAGLLLMMMKDGPVPSFFSAPSVQTWKAPKDRVKVWLTEERFPEELGWKRSERTLSVLDLAPVVTAVTARKAASAVMGQ
ncbi:Chloroperoxidase [Metarhizium brunneum]|uniref:Chloroperoxidase n=1 Tax=Metarhizium brunneum TaxID=500148 RepID=A0A7D5V022_9HYPO